MKYIILSIKSVQCDFIKVQEVFMRLGLSLVSLVLASSAVLSGCDTAADAFFSAGDRLFQPGDESAASMQTYTVAEFVRPYTVNPAKANRDYLGQWVKVRGIVADIRRVSGVAGSYFYIVSLKDAPNSNTTLKFQFGSHNNSDVEALRIGETATIIGQVHQLGNEPFPILQNPKVVH